MRRPRGSRSGPRARGVRGGRGAWGPSTTLEDGGAPRPPMTETDEILFPFGDRQPAGEGAQKTVSVHQELPLERIFTPREVPLVQQVQAFVGLAGEYAPDLRRALDTGLKGLGAIALAIEAYPSLRERRQLGTRVRSLESLMASLVDGGEHGFEWSLPTKAVLSRTFAIA